MPFWKPKVEKLSKLAIKFRKLPTSAMPLGPTNIAKILEVTRPIIIFIKTLTPLNDVILKTDDAVICFSLFTIFKP